MWTLRQKNVSDENGTAVLKGSSRGIYNAGRHASLSTKKKNTIRIAPPIFWVSVDCALYSAYEMPGNCVTVRGVRMRDTGKRRFVEPTKKRRRFVEPEQKTRIFVEPTQK